MLSLLRTVFDRMLPVVVVAAIFPVNCQSRNQFVAPPPPQVTVATPVQQKVAESMDFTGTTRATASVDLRARVNGYLKSQNFQDGTLVKQGDVLFEIERAPFENELQSAQAQLQKAKAQLEMTEADLARSAKLLDQNAITAQQLDIQSAERSKAAADVASAEAAVRKAQLNLNYSEVKAPISGRIGRHLVDVGNLVQAEQTLLAKIDSIDPIHVYFYVSERDALRFMRMNRKTKRSDLKSNPPVFHLELPGDASETLNGTLDYDESEVDPGTGTVMRRAIFPNPKHVLIPGMFVRIEAQVGQPADQLLVEERALNIDQRGDFLLTVNKENKVEYRPVKLGIAVGPMRVVEEGIKPDDRVIVNGLQLAGPGQVVRPQQEVAEKAGEAKEAAAPRAPGEPRVDSVDDADRDKQSTTTSRTGQSG